jgi:L-ribulose-5-phosphate 3-epimerase
MMMRGSGPRLGLNTYSYMLRMDALTCALRWAERGFRDFEIMVHPGHLWPAEMSGPKRRDFRRAFEHKGLRLVTINMPNVDINVAGTTDEMRAYSLGMVEGFVELAGDLGAEGVVLGPGKPNPLMPAPRERLTSYFLAALDRLAPVAVRSGTALWVENMPFAFLPDVDSLMTVLDQFGDERIGVVYDLANAYFIREDLEAGLRRVRKRLRLVHLSDTPLDVYRHSPIGEGTLDMARVPQILAGARYKDVLMLEIVSEDPDRTLLESRDRLRCLDWQASSLSAASS